MTRRYVAEPRTEATQEELVHVFRQLFSAKQPAENRSPGRNVGDAEAIQAHLEGQLTEIEDIVGNPNVKNTQELEATVARVREKVRSSDAQLPDEAVVDQLDKQLQGYYLKGADGVNVRGILDVLEPVAGTQDPSSQA